MYSALRAAGLTEPDVRRAERMLSTFALGFAASESGGRFEVGTDQLDADLAWFGDLVVRSVTSS